MKRTLAALAFVFAAASVTGCSKSGNESPSGGSSPATAPAAPPGSAPTAPAAGAAPSAAVAPTAGGGCDKYQKCCDAVAKLPNMSALTSACAQIAQFRGLPNADAACNNALSGMVQGLSSMPGGAPADCK